MHNDINLLIPHYHSKDEDWQLLMYNTNLKSSQ